MPSWFSLIGKTGSAHEARRKNDLKKQKEQKIFQNTGWLRKKKKPDYPQVL